MSRTQKSLFLVAAIAASALVSCSSTPRSDIPPPLTADAAPSAPTAPSPVDAGVDAAEPDAPSTPPKAAGVWTSGSAGRDYTYYVPSTFSATKPATYLVLLHGCDESAADFAKGTHTVAFAEKHGVVALFVEEPSSVNTQRCWNWFLPENQQRDQGEPQIVVGALRQVQSKLGGATDRVYVLGMSAGAALAVIVASCYPDVVDAALVHSGVEYKGATSAIEGFNVIRSGATLTPQDSAKAAQACAGSASKKVPVLVIHGSADQTVAPVNGDQVVQQFLALGNLLVPGSAATKPNDSKAVATTADTHAYRVDTYLDGKRTPSVPLVEQVVVSDLGHAWSGGDGTLNYNDPKGPDALELAWGFFARALPAK